MKYNTIKKSILIDLSDLEHLESGFGQIAKNYHNLFAEENKKLGYPFELHYAVPSKWHGEKRNDVTYCTLHKNHGFFQKIFPFLRKYPKPVDLWFSVNQNCYSIPREKSTRFIFTIHDLNYINECSEQNAVKEYLHKIQKKINRSSIITFISKYAEEVANKNLDLKGIETKIIYNGVESLDKNKVKKPSFVKENLPFFFYISAFYPKKKQELLLEMMKFFPDKVLYLCGNMETCYGKEIAERIKSQNIKNVIAPGKISDEERVWLYSHCEAFLFPSIGEGFGLPAIEAMQFGKPVYISNWQALPEICGGHAIIWNNLVPEDMANVIKNTIEEFYLDKNRAEKESEYANTFSYEKHIQAYMNLFESLLANPD